MPPSPLQTQQRTYSKPQPVPSRSPPAAPKIDHGPPCGVGLALAVSTRTLFGSFRTHKRYIVEVDSVLEGGPAHSCGKIARGDVLLSVRGESDKVWRQQCLAQEFLFCARAEVSSIRSVLCSRVGQCASAHEHCEGVFACACKRKTDGICYPFTRTHKHTHARVHKCISAFVGDCHVAF